ncbi:hypothetical protein CANTEDRAFT_114913, partial [Yamadazyma tenuis ATCC 10573]
MALCSQAFNKSIKRSCSATDSGATTKKTCFNSYRFPGCTLASRAIDTDTTARGVSSSDDDENSDDEQLCYKLHQIKAKRRASSRISFSLNPNLELSKFISKYSDEDEDGENHSPKNRSESDFRPYSSPPVPVEEQECDFKLVQVPKADKVSRSKCFEYLVGAIDEAWARYCDATSCIEDEVFYSDDNNNRREISQYMKGPRGASTTNAGSSYYYNNGNNTNNDDASDDHGRTLKDSDYEYDDEELEDDKSEIIDNYSVNSTDLTDMSDHYDQKSKVLANYRNNQLLSIKRSNSNKSTNQYQKMKDRLTKAKYYLQDLVDSDDYQDIQNFWNRWDMIKYATIELVEDDDDDEVIESTIDDLEAGRYFV